MLGGTPDGGPACLGNLRNNPAYPVGTALKVEGADSAANSRDLHLDSTPSGFDRVAATGWDAPRKPDGSLPDVPMLRPSAAAFIVDDFTFNPTHPDPDAGFAPGPHHTQQRPLGHEEHK
jgi:hypothetical protein